MKKIIATTTIVAFAGMACYAQLTPTKLSLFSNGTFFEKKEGNLTFKGNEAKLPIPPAALKGTFWLSGEKVKVRQIDVKIDTLKKDKPSVYLDDFLEGNEGKSITLRFKQYTSTGGSFPLRPISGTLLKFYKETGLIKLKTTEGKILLISIVDLNDADFDATARDTYKEDTLVRQATIIADNAVASAPFTQVTMQTGLQWQPSYYIKLENDSNARIVMKATVENSTEDAYNDVDLDLVVGFPQLHFGEELDPVSDYYLPAGSETYMWDFGEGAGVGGQFRRIYRKEDNITFLDGEFEQQIYNPATGTYSVVVSDVNGTTVDELNLEPANTRGLIPQIKTRGKIYETITGGVPAMYGDLTGGVIDITGNKDYSSEGKKTADLYYYKAGKVDLPKNAKTLVPVSQTTVPFKHIYEVTIGDITNYELNKTILQPEPQNIDVFHSLKLVNKTNAPITEAPVFVVNEDEAPMAQDKTNYTAIGDEVSIKLSKAIDVSVKTKEEENGREEKAKKFNKKSYDRVVLRGTIEVRNFLPKEITLNVKKALRGEVTKNDGGTVTKPGRFTAVNPVSLVKWDVKLKAGEKKTITYEYEVFISPQ